MATVKFVTKGKRNTVNVYLRLRDGRDTDIIISTGITLATEHWSKAKNWISTKATFHNKLQVENDLRELEKIVHGERNKLVGQGHPINRDWLESVIHKWQGKQIDGVADLLTDLIEQYKQELPNRIRNGKRGVSTGTLRNYNTTISRLTKFEKAKRKRFRAIEIDLNFHKNYMKFASETLGLAPNSIGKDIRNIKTVCLNAKDNGISVHDHVLSRNFSAPSEKTIFTTLNTVELDKIREFSGSNYLENARDWLIIGCWTGCRVGDLMKLTPDSIVLHKSGARIIQYTQSKTGKLVNVPMHPHVAEVIDRLEGFPRPISLAKFNDYIKTVCKKAGLTYSEYGTRQNPNTHLKETGDFEKWELIKSHTCRRSFATNHYNKMTNKQIMAVTGHATEKMLLNYIGETEVEHVDDYMTLWNDLEGETKMNLQA